MNNKIFEMVPHGKSQDPLVSDREELQGKVKEKGKYIQRNFEKISKGGIVHGLLINYPCNSLGKIVHVHLIIIRV